MCATQLAEHESVLFCCAPYRGAAQRRSGDRHGGGAFTGPNEFIARVGPGNKNDFVRLKKSHLQNRPPRLGEAYSRDGEELDLDN